MATTGSSVAFRIFFIPPREDLCVLSQGLRSVVWPDGENGRETELQLLASHRLERDLKVKRADRDGGVLWPWVHESLLDDINVLYTTSSDHKVRICIRDVVPHGEEPLRLSDRKKFVCGNESVFGCAGVAWCCSKEMYGA